MFNALMKPTWVDVGDGNMINIDTHIKHFSGVNPIDLEHDQTREVFNEACRLLLTELKRRVDREGKGNE